MACELCEKSLPRIENLNQKINQATTPSQKAPFAKELISLVDPLIAQHKRDLPCLGVLRLRKKTAELIVKAGSLRG